MKQIDRMSAMILVVYVCQMEGRPSIDEIHETVIKKLKAKIGKKEIENAAIAAKKRGLLSVNYDTDKTERYSVKDVRWANPPELAHIKAVLPKLLETKEAVDIQNKMEELHEEGKRKGRLPDIRDYVRYNLKYEVVIPVLGGDPINGINKLRRQNGLIWLPMNLWMKGALKNKLRTKNVNTSKVQYLEFDDVFLKPQKKLLEKALPSPGLPGRPGTGFSKHEGLDTGERFSFDVDFPTTGFMKEADFIKLLGDKIRIGARHKDWGKINLIKATKV